MKTLKKIIADAKAENNLRVAIFVDTVAQAVREHDDTLGMLTAFHHSANSLAIEAGIIVSHVPHDEAGKSVIGDIYFLRLLAESELRMRTLSTGYEKLRAAAIGVDNTQERSKAVQGAAMYKLLEALKNDLS